MTLILTHIWLSELLKIPNEVITSLSSLLSQSTSRNWKSFSPPLYNLIFFLMNNTQKIWCLFFLLCTQGLSITSGRIFYMISYFFLNFDFHTFSNEYYLHPEYQLSESRTPCINNSTACSRNAVRMINDI